MLAEVDVEPTPAFPGLQGRIAPLLPAITPPLIVSDPAARTVTLTGASVTLQPATAAQFNAAFAPGTDTYKPGELLGTLSFTAQAQ